MKAHLYFSDSVKGRPNSLHRPCSRDGGSGGGPVLRRTGFTIIELLIVVVTLGILAGIALPSLQHAVWRARAAEVVTDVHTVTLAYHQHMADGGGRFRSAPWGRVPPVLEAYLPDGFSFSRELVDYRWTQVPPNRGNRVGPSRGNPVGANATPWEVEMGVLQVRPEREYREKLLPMLAAVAPSATAVVTISQASFYIHP